MIMRNTSAIILLTYVIWSTPRLSYASSLNALWGDGLSEYQPYAELTAKPTVTTLRGASKPAPTFSPMATIKPTTSPKMESPTDHPESGSPSQPPSRTADYSGSNTQNIAPVLATTKPTTSPKTESPTDHPESGSPSQSPSGTAADYSGLNTQTIASVSNAESQTGTTGIFEIVGGNDVIDISPYRWYALWDAGCGATLIHKDILLSAAHCVDFSKTTAYINSNQYGRGTRLTITHMVVHPRFTAPSNGYDFSVLKLENPVNNVDPVPIATADDDPGNGDSLTVIGFGFQQEQGSWSNILQKAVVDYIPYNTCQSKYLVKGIHFSDANCICAAAPGTDACLGDSGGPLLNSRGIQTGVVSWGIGCANPDYPGVYARISSVRSWIDERVCSMSSDPPPSCYPPTNPLPTKPPTPRPTKAPVTMPTPAPVIPPSPAPMTPPTPAPVIPPSRAPMTPPTPAPMIPPSPAPMTPRTPAPVIPPSPAPMTPPTPAPISRSSFNPQPTSSPTTAPVSSSVAGSARSSCTIPENSCGIVYTGYIMHKVDNGVCQDQCAYFISFRSSMGWECGPCK